MLDLNTPTFATVGAVNHGKSSVVSTLAENDQVRISAMPGETVECQRFSLRDLFVFYDTPGFQNAPDTLREVQPAERAPEPLRLFRDFIARHRGQAEFDAECRLFAPIVEGAGVIYVVDGSRPVLDINAAEMEILRLTGRPRLAIINRSSTDDHVQEWKRRLGLHFNAVREFNAHSATFADRIELLDTLAGIEQTWQAKLRQAVALLREEWNARLGECAEIIVEMLCECLRHRETAAAPGDAGARRAALGEELKSRYMRAVSTLEARAHARIIELFGHSLVKAEANTEHLSDLFSDETWEIFGLDSRQLLGAATIGGGAAGAAVGVKVEVATGGGLFGLATTIGTLTGTLLGAGTAYVVGKQRPELSVSMPRILSRLPKGLSDLLPGKFRVGGSALAVGPYAAPNFPWILLDRAIGTFSYVINRAHARRDEATLRSAELKSRLEAHRLTSAQWSDEPRKACEKFFAAIRNGKLTRERREILRALLHKRLTEVSALRIDFG